MQYFKIEKRFYFSKILVFTLLLIGLFACGVNNEQRNFEQAALSAPKGITEMTVGGIPVEDEEADADDWRIAPEFRGLIEVQTPAYPNPVHFNGRLNIQLYITGFSPINGLYVYIFRPRINSRSGPFYVEAKLKPGIVSVRLRPSKFAQSGTGATNLYRIVIYDGSRNIITYGDVKVQ